MWTQDLSHHVDRANYFFSYFTSIFEFEILKLVRVGM